MQLAFAKKILTDGRLDAELARRQRLRELEQERLRCEGSLLEFLRSAWPSIDPSPFVESWAIDAMCDHLQAVATGQIRKLILNIPPRCSKTTISSICYPAWTWCRREIDYLSGPQVRFLCASYGHTLSIQNSNQCRR